MFRNWKIGGVGVTEPEESPGLSVDLVYEEGTIAEVQPVFNFEELTFSNDAVGEIRKFRQRFGPYQQVPLTFRYSSTETFSGYLSNFKFLDDTDQIKGKPVAIDSGDNVALLLSALDSSLVRDDFTYNDLSLVVEKVDYTQEIINLSLSSITYLYILYTQIKEIARLIGRAIEAAGNAAGLSFGTASALALELVAQSIFVASTIVQLIDYFKRIKELYFPKERTVKTISLYNMAETVLNRIGYDFVTDIEDTKDVYHLSSGNINKNEFFPRSKDRCGTALGIINLILDKYAAKIAVRNKTVFIYTEFSELFDQSNSFKLDDISTLDYTENLEDQAGTREILYSPDYQDEWTLVNFTGTEYKITANIDDPTKSTVLGLDQIDYGVALGNRKDSLNSLQEAWNSFASIANSVIALFGGGKQALKFSNDIGFAKVSSEEISVAKLIRQVGNKIPANHRDTLSAKYDEENFHWVKSHVRNPRRRRRIYEIPSQSYDEKSLSCNLESNFARTNEGVTSYIRSVKWVEDEDRAEMIVEVEDVNRDPKLIEQFFEPNS